jgi:hypothetical protein
MLTFVAQRQFTHRISIATLLIRKSYSVLDILSSLMLGNGNTFGIKHGSSFEMDKQ